MGKATDIAPFSTLGASNHSKRDRADADFYVTPPFVLEKLLELETFQNEIWEPACGSGCLSKVLEQNGFDVVSTDLYDRGYGRSGIDFLKTSTPYNPCLSGSEKCFGGDIITNPPYKLAQEFVEHAIDIVAQGSRVAMFMRLLFLEGKKHRTLFNRKPPHIVYVSSSRIRCFRNGDFTENMTNSAVAYAWFIWDKGYEGDTIVRWFN